MSPNISVMNSLMWLTSVVQSKTMARVVVVRIRSPLGSSHASMSCTSSNWSTVTSHGPDRPDLDQAAQGHDLVGQAPPQQKSGFPAL